MNADQFDALEAVHTFLLSKCHNKWARRAYNPSILSEFMVEGKQRYSANAGHLPISAGCRFMAVSLILRNMKRQHRKVENQRSNEYHEIVMTHLKNGR